MWEGGREGGKQDNVPATRETEIPSGPLIKERSIRIISASISLSSARAHREGGREKEKEKHETTYQQPAKYLSQAAPR